MPAAKQLIMSYSRRIWEDKDLNAIDEFLHPDILIRSLPEDVHGRKAMSDIIQACFIGFPDLKVTFTSVMSEKDVVMTQWCACGTHLGEFKGFKPTGRLIKYSGVTIYRVCRNLITEYWAYLDMQNIINQIS